MFCTSSYSSRAFPIIWSRRNSFVLLSSTLSINCVIALSYKNLYFTQVFHVESHIIETFHNFVLYHHHDAFSNRY